MGKGAHVISAIPDRIPGTLAPEAVWRSLPSSLLSSGERRMEAENYLADGYRTRLDVESRGTGWLRLDELARIWQPSRLKGIQVGPEYGTPFLAATQMFDARPVPRKFLSLNRTDSSAERFVKAGTVLVTCSGNVGRSILALEAEERVLVSHDLLRIEPVSNKYWGWLYAFLRAPQARNMMMAAQYGHIIKHLEVSHLGAIPMPGLPESLLDDFNSEVRRLLDMRNKTRSLLQRAEDIYTQRMGPISAVGDPEVGFSVNARALFGTRRRLEGAFHDPRAAAIVRKLHEAGDQVEPLSAVAERVWWLSRFKRIFGDRGAPYMSADELFSSNPPIGKRVLLEQAERAEDYFVKAGWIVMACSGQAYGLLGSVALMAPRHERAFLSHDLIRIVPRSDVIRPGYLYMTLGHPLLGRPLAVRNAYGTSIPHLEPSDIAEFPVVRLEEAVEDEIADLVEEAVLLRASADDIEDVLASTADQIISDFVEGATILPDAYRLTAANDARQVAPGIVEVTKNEAAPLGNEA